MGAISKCERYERAAARCASESRAHEFCRVEAAMNPVALVLLIVEGLLGVTVIGGVVWAEFFAGRKHLG